MVTFKVENLKNMTAQIGVFVEFLRSRNIPDNDVFLSRLVSSELISNVIRHGGEAAEFYGEIMSDRISITVKAQSQKGVNLKPSAPDVFAENGRGLYIVNSVCIGDIERGDDGELTVYIKRTDL